MSAVEGVVIALAGRTGDDEELAQRVAMGLLSRYGGEGKIDSVRPARSSSSRSA